MCFLGKRNIFILAHEDKELRGSREMDAEVSFWQLMKRPKVDYVIIIIAFLLLASNQVFETTPLRASGNIEITNGSAIPQDTNYTITTISVPSVTSAVLLNESIERNSLYFDVLVENVIKIVYNITLQSTLENTSVRITMNLGSFDTHLDVIVGIIPTTYSIEPDIVQPDYWITWSSVRIITNTEMNLQNLLIGAEFDTPVSPVVLNWQTTDGYGLFDNPYTRLMHNYQPELEIQRESDGSSQEFYASFQNCSLYLRPQNYTFYPSWGGRNYDQMRFNITVYENVTSICTIRMKAVRVNLLIVSNSPLIRLTIRHDGFDSYCLYLQETEIPEFIYIPPSFELDIEVATISPHTSSQYFNGDFFVRGSTLSNATKHFHVKITMPYALILGLLITPQDFIQISLAMILFAFIIFRLFLFLHSKKPRTSWKDPRLIPILLIGITACIPWFIAIHENLYFSDITIHVASLGAFPLIASWTESSAIFLAIPPNGLAWFFTSLLLFWIPLLYANYATTPPSNIGHNFLAAILLFSPLLFMANVQWWLNEYNSFPFIPLDYFPSFLLIVPSIFLICLLILRTADQYKYGHDCNQLSFDVKLSPQLLEKKEQPDETKSESTPVEKEVQKTLILIFLILQYLLLLIPTSIGFFLQQSGSEYMLNQVYFGNPIYGFGSLLDALIGSPGLLIFWVLTVPIYYLFTTGLLMEYELLSRRVLSSIFFVLWVTFPLFIHNTLFIFTVFFQYGGLEWILISLPYYFLSFVAVMKIGDYIREEISFHKLQSWILIPGIIVIPGGLLLNLIATLQMAAMQNYVAVWFPLPITTILLIIVSWSLKRWIQSIRLNHDVDSDLDEMLHSNDMTGDL